MIFVSHSWDLKLSAKEVPHFGWNHWLAISGIFNQILKQIGAKMPSLQVTFTRQVTYKRELQTIVKKKYEFLQTHTARRSFCSNE